MAVSFLFQRTVFFSVLLLFSCATKATSRIERVVDHYDELLVSNTPTLNSYPKPFNQAGDAEVQFSILIQNFSRTRTYPVLIGLAEFMIRDQPIKASCVEHEKAASDVDLEPGKLLRVDCRIRVVVDDENQLKLKDTAGYLRIPYGEVSRRKWMTFKYQLRTTDFQ